MWGILVYESMHAIGIRNCSIELVAYCSVGLSYLFLALCLCRKMPPAFLRGALPRWEHPRRFGAIRWVVEEPVMHYTRNTHAVILPLYFFQARMKNKNGPLPNHTYIGMWIA